MYFFFFNDTATTEIYTLSLHDALPIYIPQLLADDAPAQETPRGRHYGDWQHCEASVAAQPTQEIDRKSTRLNSSHGYISYAVFCLKKKTVSSRMRATRGALIESVSQPI